MRPRPVRSRSCSAATNAERRPEPGPEVDERRADAHARPVGFPGQADDPGGRLHQRVVAREVAQRAGRAVGADRAGDEPRCCARAASSAPRPSRSAVPGRMLWTKTSARSASRSTASRPAGALTSSASERLPAFAAKKSALPAGANAGPQARASSPAQGMLDLDDVGAERAEQLRARRARRASSSGRARACPRAVRTRSRPVHRSSRFRLALVTHPAHLPSRLESRVGVSGGPTVTCPFRDEGWKDVARLLVTGASGYLGRALVERARAAGWELETDRVELRDAEAVAAHVGASAPTPSCTPPTARIRRRSRGARTSTAPRPSRGPRATAGARLVHLSTDVVFDGRKGAPYVEEDALTPITDYGRSKAEAERRVAAAHPHALLVRTSLIVGGPGAEPSKHERAALDPDTTFFTNEIRSPVQVGDLADALLELAALERRRPAPRRRRRRPLASRARRADRRPPARGRRCAADPPARLQPRLVPRPRAPAHAPARRTRALPPG